MHPHYRAQLAAAVTHFLADIRRLGQAKLRGERDRLLSALEPSRTRATATASRRRPGRPARAAATEPSRGPAIVGRRGPAIVGRRAPKAGAAKPTKSKRRSTPTRTAPERATASPRQRPAPAPIAGPAPRRAATETAPDTSGICSAAVIAAPVIVPPQATATPVIAAPVPASPAIEASSQRAGGLGADVRGPGELAATTRHPERSPEGVRRRGIVKWFSASKGYGFVRGDDGEDAFVHVSAVASAGLRTLIQGQAVEYELRRNAKGLHAVSLSLLDAGTLRSA